MLRVGKKSSVFVLALLCVVVNAGPRKNIRVSSGNTTSFSFRSVQSRFETKEKPSSQFCTPGIMSSLIPPASSAAAAASTTPSEGASSLVGNWKGVLHEQVQAIFRTSGALKHVLEESVVTHDAKEIEGRARGDPRKRHVLQGETEGEGADRGGGWFGQGGLPGRIGGIL